MIGSLRVSVVGLGCNNFGWRIDEAATHEVVHAALDAGITFFDTADIYGGGASEEFLGRALGPRCRDAVIATKFGHRSGHPDRGASPAWIRRAVEASLRRLGTDVIDLYQIHTPDPAVPIAETLGALDELVRAGKVREIGCSNFTAAQLRAAAAAGAPGAARFASVQNHYSLVAREDEQREVLAHCEESGVAFLPYYPLASGLLTGKYRASGPLPRETRLADEGRYSSWLTPERLDLVERLAGFAESRGHTILELAFAWLLAHRPIASVIAGATSPAQVRSNAAAGGWRLTEPEREEVDAILAHA